MTGILILIFRILLIISLYVFLGWALLTLWRELRASQMLASAQKGPVLTIHRLEGEKPAQEFTHSQILIGRDPDCEVHLAHEMVSAQHARLSFHHNQWWIEDLSSTNGTFLNDERVFAPTVLISGDEVRCGRTSLNITFENKNPHK
jgi:hypothetical protein